MYVPLNTPGVTHDATADFALAVGQVMERQMPGKVTTVMAKVERPGQDLRRLESERAPQDDDRARTRCALGPIRRCRRR